MTLEKTLSDDDSGYCFIDISNENNLNATLSIFRTFFICFVLTGSAMLFN